MQKVRLHRWWLYIAGAAAVAIVLIVAAVLAGSRLEPQELVTLVSTKVEQRTGRALAIEGPVRYSLSLTPTVIAEGVRLQNAAWGSRPDMLSARRIEVRIALLPLLLGKVQVRGLELVEPDLLLEIDRNGSRNWELDSAPARSAETDPPSQQNEIAIPRLRVSGGKLAYRNAGSGREFRASDLALDIDPNALGTGIDGSGRIEGVPLEIAAKLPLQAAAGAREKAEATLSGPGISLHAEGEMAPGIQPQAGNLAVSLTLSDWRAAGKLLGTDLRQRAPLAAKGMLRWDANSLALEQLEASIGSSAASGHLKLLAAEKGQRRLEARFESPSMHLAELLGPGPARSRNDGRIFSADPLPLALLPALHGSVDVRIARLALRDGKSIEGVQIDAHFDGGRITLEPALMQLEGRPLKLQARADAANGKTIKLDLAVDGKAIPLGALGALLDITGTPEGSPTDLNIRLRAQGGSARALMASASGDVRIVVGPGRLRNRAVNFGADVTEFLKVLNPAYAGDTYTELKCAVIRLPLRQGVARVQNSIGVETGKVDILGAGTIDFRHETLDLGFRTKAATGLGLGLGTLAELGRVRGTLADPKLEVDLGGAAETAAHLGLAAVTGGLSLIASGLLAERVPDHPCQVALSGVETRRAATEPSNVVDSLVDRIKNFFGN